MVATVSFLFGAGNESYEGFIKTSHQQGIDRLSRHVH